MARYIEIILPKRNVRCAARLLEEEAPKTCAVVWRSLPQEGEVYHAKYASNEIYTIVPQLAKKEPRNENRTICPIPGDVMYFYLPPGTRIPQAAKPLAAGGRALIDLAVFYDRNNLLFSPSEGLTPGNVFATIVKGMDEMKAAGHSVWREGAIGERLIFRPIEGAGLKKWNLK